MTERARRILASALRLPQRERWHLVAQLMKTLDDDHEPLSQKELERLWAEEIDRRVRRIEQGKEKLVDADVVMKCARRLARRRSGG